MGRKKIYDSPVERQQARTDRTKLGICYTCGKANDRFPNGIRCSPCQKKGNASRNRLRQSRKKAGLCGCGNKKLEHVTRCEKCWFENYSVKLYQTTRHWKELKQLLVGQSGLCFYTGEKLVIGKTASIEHVIPQAKEGTHHMSNLRWVTKTVNYMKRDLQYDDFITLCELVVKTHKGRPRKNRD